MCFHQKKQFYRIIRQATVWLSSLSSCGSLLLHHRVDVPRLEIIHLMLCCNKNFNHHRIIIQKLLSLPMRLIILKYLWRLPSPHKSLIMIRTQFVRPMRIRMWVRIKEFDAQKLTVIGIFIFKISYIMFTISLYYTTVLHLLHLSAIVCLSIPTRLLSFLSRTVSGWLEPAVFSRLAQFLFVLMTV